jgi:hypothetical protein
MKGTALAADHSDKDCRQIKDARRDATGPKVVKEGDRYPNVRFTVDEVGVTPREDPARDIPTKTGLEFAGVVALRRSSMGIFRQSRVERDCE